MRNTRVWESLDSRKAPPPPSEGPREPPRIRVRRDGLRAARLVPTDPIRSVDLKGSAIGTRIT
jgi:hypothetical protein